MIKSRNMRAENRKSNEVYKVGTFDNEIFPTHLWNNTQIFDIAFMSLRHSCLDLMFQFWSLIKHILI